MHRLPGSARSPRFIRSYVGLIIALTPLLFAVIALLLGKDAGWDFQNYHWYNPYALLHQRLGFDIAVAHHATYYNPSIDLPFYWLATHGPAWLSGAVLGALFGIAVILIGAIAYQVFPCRNAYRRLAIAALLALFAAAGGGAFPAIGGTSNDVPVAIGVFAALLILLRNFTELQRVELNRKLLAVMFSAGIFIGMAVGLKLTTAIYAPGLFIAVVVCVPGLGKRTACVVTLGVGMTVGIALFAGYWMQRMWSFGANPVFPYFNQVFHSPLLVADSYRDPSHFPPTPLMAWLYPFYFTDNSYLVAEWDFRDMHLLIAYVLVPIALLLMAFKRSNRDSLVKPQLALFLFLFAGASYLAWLLLFCIYRYVIPLEMLAPILIVCAILLLPLRRPVQIGLLIAIAVVSQAAVKMTFERQAWDPSYVVVATPSLPDAQHSMVLLSGTAPMAFVIPYFPAAISFLRIDGFMVRKEDHRSGLAVQLHQRVAAHDGPLYLLFATKERGEALQAIAEYELGFAPEPCQWVSSNIAKPLELCRLSRHAHSS